MASAHSIYCIYIIYNTQLGFCFTTVYNSDYLFQYEYKLLDKKIEKIMIYKKCVHIQELFEKSLINELKYLHLERLQDLEPYTFRLKSAVWHFLDLLGNGTEALLSSSIQ